MLIARSPKTFASVGTRRSSDAGIVSSMAFAPQHQARNERILPRYVVHLFDSVARQLPAEEELTESARRIHSR